MRGVHARVDERDAQRERTGHLHLDVLRRARLLRGDLEEGQQPAVRLVVEQRLQPADGVDAGRELDAAVVVHDDSGNRARPLRDDAFARRAQRQLRHGGQLGEAPQRECGGRVRITMGKASDGGCRPRADRPAEQWLIHEDS